MMLKHILFLNALLFSLAANAHESYWATVNSVHDGDTIRVTDTCGHKQRVRLAYIDAPEVNPAQAFGMASRNALREHILHQKVRVTVLDTDRYNRQVAQILFNGRDINLQQVQQGYAWHYHSIARRNQNPADFLRYETAENEAKQQRIGLWHSNKPVAPWTFRRQTRQSWKY